jgi:hypothetical protein
MDSRAILLDYTLLHRIRILESLMTASLLPPRSAEVGDIMDATMRVFRATLPKCLPLAMLSILLAQLASLYELARGRAPDLLKTHDASFWALFALGFAAWQLLAAIIMLRQRSMVSGRVPDLSGEWRAALQRWPLLLVTAVLSGAVMALGFVLLIVPGIYAFVCFLLLRPVVLFENVDPLRALERCIHLAKPRWVKLCAAAVMGTLIVAVCTLAAVAALSLLAALLAGVGIKAAATNAVGAAALLGVLSVAAVYFSALWLALYSVASSSA